MADILISKFTTQIPRVGATPATPGFAESEGQDPVAPSGSPQVYTPVTIGSPTNGLSIDGSQVLTIGLASTSDNGALSSTDWNTFNGKLNLTSPITGYTVGANTALVDTDTILQAFGKVQGQINARISGTIASGQVAFGTGVNTVGGGNITWNNASNILELIGSSTIRTSTGSITLASIAGNSDIVIIPSGTGRIQLRQGGDPIIMGADSGLITISANTDKRLRIGFPRYIGGGVPVSLISGSANINTNIIDIGGVQGGFSRAADLVRIFIGATYDASSATELVRFVSAGVGIGNISPTNTLDVNGTARIRTISNLGSAATSVLVPSATGVVSLRTLAELASDGLGSKWTDVTGGIFRNGAVAVGRTTIPTSATFAVQSLTTTATHEFFQVLNNSGSQIFTINNSNVSQFKTSVITIGNPTSFISTGATFKSNSNASEAIFRVINSDETLRFEVWGTGQIRCYSHFIAVGNSISSFALQGATFKGNSVTTGEIFKIMNSSETSIFSVLGNGTITYLDGANWALGTTTGTRIGTATNQRLAFWNKTPIVQPTNAIGAGAFVANTSGIANDTATYGGYTMGQIAQALINIGILA